MSNGWTNKEIARLRIAFPEMSRPQLEEAFPRHTFGSIKATAYALKLRRGKTGHRMWMAIARRHVPMILRQDGTTIDQREAI